MEVRWRVGSAFVIRVGNEVNGSFKGFWVIREIGSLVHRKGFLSYGRGRGVGICGGRLIEIKRGGEAREGGACGYGE